MSIMAIAILTLTSGSGQAGGQHDNSTQAFFVAESGAERALYRVRRLRVACNNLAAGGTGTLTIGGGTGTYVTSGVLYAPAATALSAAINATTTTIPVNSVAGYAPRGRIAVAGGEAMSYTGTSTSAAVCGGGVPACFTGATRGAGGTTAAAAALGTPVNQRQCSITSVGTAYSTQRTVERAIFTGGTAAMVVYVKETNLGVPYYRLWNGAAWGAEATATNVGSEIRYIVLKTARTRNETIMVTQSANGQIRAQIWNGVSWSNGTVVGATLLLGTITNAGDRDYRAFDVEYETASDRAMVVYRNADNADPDYRIWTGTAWTAAATAVPNATAGRPRWIELAPNPTPTSNEIVMIVADSNDDVHGTRWTPAGGWDNMGVAGVWDASAATTDSKVIDVVYEQTGQRRALFAWLDSNTCVNGVNYRLLTGAALGANLTFGPWTGCDSDGRWIKLAADPFSQNIMVGIQEADANAATADGNNDVGTCLWNGTAWDCSAANHPIHVEDPEAPNGNSRVFDIVFTADPANAGQAWMVWGALAGGGTNIWRKAWTPGVGWDAAPTVILGPDVCFPTLLAHPNAAVIFAGVYEDADTGDVSMTQLAGGIWSAPQVFWNGGSLDCQGNVRVHERVALTADGAGFNVLEWQEIFP